MALALPVLFTLILTGFLLWPIFRDPQRLQEASAQQGLLDARERQLRSLKDLRNDLAGGQISQEDYTDLEAEIGKELHDILDEIENESGTS